MDLSLVLIGSVEHSLGVPIYFALSYWSTDKRHIEHANALIRQYLPKHSSFSGWAQKGIKDIECALNKPIQEKVRIQNSTRNFDLN